MTSARGSYAGVLSILRYNWRAYVLSAVVLFTIAALLWFRPLPLVVQISLGLAGALTLFWALSSLVASYYVYDYIAVTRWHWIPRILSSPPKYWLNIHAGLDESTQTLQDFYPDATHVVLDIYDPLEMTEPSIASARQAHLAAQPVAQACKLDALPVPDGDRDTVFLLFAAHEIRQPDRRVDFFREAARVLSNSGQLLLVEHLRDWKNFIAFGPGAFHFHSHNEWRRVAREAGFKVAHEENITPLVRCFLLSKAAR